MKQINMMVGTMVADFICFGLQTSPRLAAAHCDTMDGPVVNLVVPVKAGIRSAMGMLSKL